MNRRERQLISNLAEMVAPIVAQARPRGHRLGGTPAGLSVRNVSPDTAELQIYGHIGGGGFFDEGGISASDVSALLAETRAANLHVRINSGGGDYFQGVAILSQLSRHPATVTTSVDGMAASAASVIMLAGDVVEVAPGSLVMMHDAMTGPYGNAATLRKEADLLDKVSDVIAELYADRAGEDAAHWRNLMTVNGEDGTWFTADEAVAAGLADRVARSADDSVTVRNLRSWSALLPEKLRAALPEQEPEHSEDAPEQDEDDAALPEPEPSVAENPHDATDDLSNFAHTMRMWAWLTEHRLTGAGRN